MLPYYQIRSMLPQVVSSEINRFLEELSTAIDEPLQSVSLDTYIDSDFGLLFVASGGSENYFLEVYKRLKNRTCYILSHSESNSLAAAMEILSFLQKNGIPGEILHGDTMTIAKRICSLRNAYRAVHTLADKQIGVVGKPSDWLIASDYSAAAVAEKLSVGTVHIPMEELIAEIKRNTAYPENEWTDILNRMDYDKGEMQKALNVYGALYRIVEQYRLSAVTVRCFDLLSQINATGCIGLAILNAQKIYGGCEGDIPALLSMLILGEVTNEPTFLFNPSRLDTAGGNALFAHCTLPLDMTESFTLDTHFESKLGVAINGQIREGNCTIFKTSGDLMRCFVAEGTILSRPHESSCCRTQVTVRLDCLDSFLKHPIGNHHVLCFGRHADAIENFFSLIGSEK